MQATKNKNENVVFALLMIALETTLMVVLTIYRFSWFSATPWPIGVGLLVGVSLINAVLCANILAAMTESPKAKWRDASMITAAAVVVPLIPTASLLDSAIPTGVVLLSLSIRCLFWTSERD